MADQYVLRGFAVLHDVRVRTETFVEAVCGAQAHFSRLGVIRDIPNPTYCMDCKLLSRSEMQARRHGRYSPPFVQELE